MVCSTSLEEIAAHNVWGMQLGRLSFWQQASIYVDLSELPNPLPLMSLGSSFLSFRATTKRTCSHPQDYLTTLLSSPAGYCQGPGYRVGFGDCSGKVLPAQLIWLSSFKSIQEEKEAGGFFSSCFWCYDLLVQKNAVFFPLWAFKPLNFYNGLNFLLFVLIINFKF